MAVPPQAGPMWAPGGKMARAAGATARIVTLKKRPEFLAARRGARWATPLFVLEALKRPDASEGLGPRFGFTVSKQVGGAVARNRIKRRLRAAVAQTQTAHAAPLYDYVLIARQPALEAPFAVLAAELATALDRVVRVKRQGHRSKPPAKRAPT